jgi:quercetin dioxygenase-like cupin family protein
MASKLTISNKLLTVMDNPSCRRGNNITFLISSLIMCIVGATMHQSLARVGIGLGLSRLKLLVWQRRLKKLCAMRKLTMQKSLNPTHSHVVRDGDGKRFDVLGAHMVWKARGDDTDGTITMSVLTLAPNEQIPLHRHSYPEIFFVTSGTVVFTLTRNSEEVRETVAQGDTVVVAANSYHSFINASDVSATMLDIACHEHQQFFDDVQQEHQSWQGLTPDQAMQQVGEIGLRHTMEFRVPG